MISLSRVPAAVATETANSTSIESPRRIISKNTNRLAGRKVSFHLLELVSCRDKFHSVWCVVLSSTVSATTYLASLRLL
jgi:hypothetical protein